MLPRSHAAALAHEESCALLHHIIRICDSVPNSAGIFENLVVVAAGSSFVAEEMYLAVIFLLHELEAIALVPTVGETIKADLSAN